jgi:hypothetical protein
MGRKADELTKVQRDAERLRRAHAKRWGLLEFEPYFWPLAANRRRVS